MSPILKKSILFLFLTLTHFSLFAQIGLSKAKDLLKEKKENASQTKPETPSAQTPAPSNTQPRSAQTTKSDTPTESAQVKRTKPGANDKYKASEVELDFSSQPFAPAIAWADLLSSKSWYFDCTTGSMKLTNIQASFLPTKTTSGAEVKYQSYSNVTPLLRMEVWETKSNTLVNTMHYSGAPATAPFFDLTVIEGYDYKPYATLKEGSYELRFWVGTKHFYTFPFQVEKKSNPDPYAPVHDFYFLKGPWQDWGRVEFGPDGHFIFNFYLNHETTTVVNQAQWNVKKDYKYLMKLYRDGKMVAVHHLQSSGNGFDEADLQAHNGVWESFDGTFHKYPNTGSRDFFMKSDLKDGNYTVEVWLKDKEGAETTLKYGFTVKNNQVVSNIKADRTQNTDPLQFLEQGRDRVYVKKI